MVVEDPGRKSRLAALAGGQKHIEQSPTFLVWLAPRSYESGLWQSGWTAAATSVGAYLAFAAGLYALADLRLRKRDL
jgi:hypothetical protein